MGFLHLGWDSAMKDDQLDVPLVQLSPVWAEVGRSVNLERPGLPCVRRIMGWSPLHIAAMEGEVRTHAALYLVEFNHMFIRCFSCNERC